MIEKRSENNTKHKHTHTRVHSFVFTRIHMQHLFFLGDAFLFAATPKLDSFLHVRTQKRAQVAHDISHIELNTICFFAIAAVVVAIATLAHTHTRHHLREREPPFQFQ